MHFRHCDICLASDILHGVGFGQTTALPDLNIDIRYVKETSLFFQEPP